MFILHPIANTYIDYFTAFEAVFQQKGLFENQKTGHFFMQKRCPVLITKQYSFKDSWN